MDEPVARERTARHDVPMAIGELLTAQLEDLGDLRRRQCAGKVLLVRKDEQRRTSEFLDVGTKTTTQERMNRTSWTWGEMWNPDC